MILTRCAAARIPHKRRIEQNSTLEITQTCSPYFRECRRLHKGDHGRGVHLLRRLDEIANVDSVARYRTADRICNSYTSTMKESTPSLIYTHFGLSGWSGRQEPHIRSGWTILNFAATLRTGTTFQCETLIGSVEVFCRITVKRNTRGNIKSSFNVAEPTFVQG